MKNRLITVLQGIVMGIVEVIPGVSGSTLALVMGIYDDFVDLLHDVSTFGKSVLFFMIGKKTFEEVKLDFFRINFVFGGFLFLGMLIGILVFAHVMSYLLENFPTYTYGFFFGLIIASLRVPWSHIPASSKKMTSVLLILLSFLITFLILGIKPAVSVTNPNPILALVGGFFAICAMILPGVSGSFILLMFGLYDYVILGIKEFTKLSISLNHFIDLSFVGVGIILGFTFFVRLLKKLLVNYRGEIMAVLIGLMLGSLRIIWPFMDVNSAEELTSMTKTLPFSSTVQTQESFIIFGIIFLTMIGIHLINQPASNKNLPKNLPSDL